MTKLLPATVRKALKNGPFVPMIAVLVACLVLGAVQLVLDSHRTAAVEVQVGPSPASP